MSYFGPQTTFQCPHCEVLSLQNAQIANIDYEQKMQIMGTDGVLHEVDAPMKSMIYRCVNCGKNTYFLVQSEIRLQAAGTPTGNDRALPAPKVLIEQPQIIVHQYPVYISSSHSAVPKEVSEAMLEAEKCVSVGAYNACAVMARRAIHSLCSDKGATGDDLYKQLKYMKDNNSITPDLWEWAEEIRIVGRSGAHPEWEEVSADDAEYAVKFLREIIRYVYVNPHERATKRLKETKKKK